MKDIKQRIRSVENTMQITKAMELVASSKMKRAKARAESARPYFNTLRTAMLQIAADTTGLKSVYTDKRDVKNVGLIVVAGDRGLAGGFNSNVFKLADEISKGKNVKIIAIGKKTCEHYSKPQYTMIGQYPNVGQIITAEIANGIAKEVEKAYLKHEIDEVYMIHTNFVSPLLQQAVSAKILPLNLEQEAEKGEKIGKVLTEYEPSPEEVFDKIIPMYLTGMIYGAVVESFASEQAARRVAMESATDNAGEMIEELSIKFNRARQGAITQELTEIIGGADALA